MRTPQASSMFSPSVLVFGLFLSDGPVGQAWAYPSALVQGYIAFDRWLSVAEGKLPGVLWSDRLEEKGGRWWRIPLPDHGPGEAAEDSGTPWLPLELQFRQRPLGWEEAAAIAERVRLRLAALERRGVRHGGLTPSSVWMAGEEAFPGDRGVAGRFGCSEQLRIPAAGQAGLPGAGGQAALLVGHPRRDATEGTRLNANSAWRPVRDPCPLRAGIIPQLGLALGVPPAVEVAPVERAVAPAASGSGLQQRAVEGEAALHAPLATVFGPGPIGAEAKLRGFRGESRRGRQGKTEHPAVFRVPEPFPDLPAAPPDQGEPVPVIPEAVPVAKKIPGIQRAEQAGEKTPGKDGARAQGQEQETRQRPAHPGERLRGGGRRCPGILPGVLPGFGG